MTGSKSLRITSFVVAVGLLIALRVDQSFAQKPGTAEGYWRGILQTASGSREAFVWINRNPEGAWGGTIDIPAQSMADFPLIVTGEGRTASFRYPGGAASFKGTLSADSNKLTGEFVEEGKSYPFELTRQPGPPQPAASPADKALAHARRVVELLRQDKFADVAKELTPQAAASLTAGTLREKWSALRTQFGAYKNEISHTADPVANLHIVTLGAQFERGTQNVVIVIDGNDSVNGIQFVPRPK